MKLEIDKKLNSKAVLVIFKNEFAIIRDKDEVEYEKMKFRFNYEAIGDTIFENNKQINDIPYAYGKQILEIYYQDSLLGHMGLWKTNNWHSHRYKIRIFEENDSVKFEGDFYGPDKRGSS